MYFDVFFTPSRESLMLISQRSVVGSPDGNTNYRSEKNFFSGFAESRHEGRKARELKAAYVHHGREI